MVGIEVLTIVASMAKRKITSITPATAKVRLESAPDDDSWEKFTLRDQVEYF